MNTTKQQLQKQLSVNVQLQQHIILVSCLIKQLIENQSECSISQSIFDMKSKPQISLQDYLRRIHKLTKYSPQSLIIAVIIMDRYNMENDQFTISWLNVHRLMLSCLVLAVKLHDDFYFDNRAFQTAGGVNLVMIQKYQAHIFSKCHFNLYVDQEQYQDFVDGLYNAYANNDSDTDQESRSL